MAMPFAWASHLFCDFVDDRRMSSHYVQVEEHDSRESAWFVYENKVYDATRFLNDHPGGPESILIVAGQVCTLLLFCLHLKRCILTPLSKEPRQVA
jgi:cytochrome b involved in lipid metabolism